MAKSPVSIPFSTDGLELAVKDGDTLVANSRGSVLVGANGSTAKFVNVDSSGRVLVVGAGVAGTPAGGVVSVQGVTGGQAIPISASSLPLPTGAATEATLGSVLTTTAFQARINTLGQKTMANSTPVVLSSDQTVIQVSDNGSSLTVDSTQLPSALVSGRLDVNTGAWLGSTAPTVGSKTSANSIPVVIASDQGAVAISAASLPLPTGAATEATLGGVLTTSAFQARINTLGQKTMANSTPVTLASDQSAVPISGTITANIGTSGSLALDATLTGGTQKAIVRGGAKGATTAADVTSTAEGTDHQALDVQIYHGSTAINPTAIRALTSSDVVTAAQGTAAGLSGYWPVRITDGTNTMPTADTAARSSFHRVTDGTNTAAVKAASTAPVAGDPALVVAISPNSSLTASNPSVGTIGAATPSSATTIGGTDGTNLQTVRIKPASTAAVAADPALVVAISPNNPISVGAPADGTASGSLTAATQTVETAAAAGQGTAAIQVSGTWSATLVFEGTVDGTNWSTLTVRPIGNATTATTASANGIWRAALAGLQKIRVRCSAYTSGTAVVTIRTTTGDGLGQTEVSPTVLTTANAAAAGLFAGVTSYGYLRCAVEPSALFNDCFEGSTLDTTVRWDTPTQTGSGTVSLFSGTVALSCGTNTNSKAAISSKPRFGSNIGLGLLAWGCLISQPATIGTNGHMFWGLGQVDGGWSVSSPLLNGVGFEINSSGTFRACVYSGSTLVYSQNLTVPAAGLQRYVIVWRNDVIFWYVGTTEYPAATLSLSWPGFPGFPFLGDVSVFPLRFHCITGASVPSQSVSFEASGLGVGDTSHSNNMISDGDYPWRKTKVSSSGELHVKESPSLGYVVNITSVATANNKSMASIVNASSAYNVRVLQIWLINTQTTAVTGVNCTFGLRRCTGHSVGTDWSSQYTALDSINTNPTSIATIRTGGTITGESALLIARNIWTTEELTAAITYPLYEKIAQYTEPFFGKKGQEILLRNGEGVTLKCETNTTTGSFDVRIVYTLELV